MSIFLITSIVVLTFFDNNSNYMRQEKLINIALLNGFVHPYVSFQNISSQFRCLYSYVNNQ